MSAEDLAAVIGGIGGGGVGMRTMAVVAVNAGPPKSLDLAETVGGAAVLAGVRYAATYFTIVPAVGDVVIVLVSRAGGSGRMGGRDRGGSAFVVDRVAV